MYFGLSIVSLLSFIVLTWILSSIAVYYFFGSSEPTSGPLETLRRVIMLVPEAIAEIRKEHDRDDWGGVIATGILVGVGGTITICLIPILVIFAINLFHALALCVLRTDNFLRYVYQWNQEDIMKNPVNYLGATVGSMTFAFLSVLLIARAVASWAIP